MALSLGLGLLRVFKGPAIEDRIMSAQLVGTTGVGLLLLLCFTARHAVKHRRGTGAGVACSRGRSRVDPAGKTFGCAP